ncbi:hypothetical protein WKW80_09260 [Variovorax humicola]|uniref:Uncharacterized protein n=1 Tax=Variovorax humicola TaxID=1769758 RepID=A0ABU8VWN2_9BURK
MDLDVHLCVQVGDLTRTDAHWLTLSPQPRRHQGKSFVPAMQPFPSNWTEVGAIGGNAIVYGFSAPDELQAFCAATGAIEATMFQQIPA